MDCVAVVIFRARSLLRHPLVPSCCLSCLILGSLGAIERTWPWKPERSDSNPSLTVDYVHSAALGKLLDLLGLNFLPTKNPKKPSILEVI
jgi:hypothetical protein